MLLRFHGDRWEEIAINRQIHHNEGGNGDVTETATVSTTIKDQSGRTSTAETGGPLLVHMDLPCLCRQGEELDQTMRPPGAQTYLITIPLM